MISITKCPHWKGRLHMSPVSGLARLPGRILWDVHMGNFSPVDRDEFKNTTKMVEHKLVLFATVIALWTLVTLLIKLIRHTRPKLCHFGPYVVRAKLFCLKSFVPVTGLECSYEKIFIPAPEISVAKTEISVIGPTRPLI